MTFHLFLSLSWTMTLLILSLPLASKQLSPGFLPIFLPLLSTLLACDPHSSYKMLTIF